MLAKISGRLELVRMRVRFSVSVWITNRIRASPEHYVKFLCCSSFP